VEAELERMRQREVQDLRSETQTLRAEVERMRQVSFAMNRMYFEKTSLP
jgi:hypothetical protein